MSVLVQLEIVPEVERIRLPQKVGNMQVLMGGPVETSRGFVLHSPDFHLSQLTLPIDDGICLTASDIGLPGNDVAYPHPTCPVHGDEPDHHGGRSGWLRAAASDHRDVDAHVGTIDAADYHRALAASTFRIPLGGVTAVKQATLDELVAGHLEHVRTGFGRFSRQVSGYALEHLLQDIRAAANVTTRTTVVLSTFYEDRPPL